MDNFKTYQFSSNLSELLESPSEELEKIERRGPYERIIPEVIEKPLEELPKHGRRELHVVEPIKPEINENPLEKIQEQEPGNQKRSGLEENDQEPKMKKVRYFSENTCYNWHQSIPVTPEPRGVLVFLNFPHFSTEHRQTGSLGTT